MIDGDENHVTETANWRVTGRIGKGSSFREREVIPNESTKQANKVTGKTVVHHVSIPKNRNRLLEKLIVQLGVLGNVPTVSLNLQSILERMQVPYTGTWKDKRECHSLV